MSLDDELAVEEECGRELRDCLRLLAECEFMNGQSWSYELVRDVREALERHKIGELKRKDVRGEN